MKWGTGGWGAILCTLIAFSGAHAQPTRSAQAQLGSPDTPPLPVAPNPDELFSPGPKSPAPPRVPIHAVAVQGDPEKKDASFSPLIQLTPPNPERLFRMDSEEKVFDRIRVEREELRLPAMELPPMTKKTPSAVPTPRLWDTLAAVAEPCYLCYRRTYFEQRAFERYGWNIGMIQPPISALVFYADLLTLPLNWALDPCRDFECNAGLCLPGDPTPLMWYRRVK